MLRDRKKRSSEAKEIIETIGEEGSKGVNAAKQYFKEAETENTKAVERNKDILDSHRTKRNIYSGILASQMAEYLKNIPWTNEWSYKVGVTDTGILLQVKGPGGKFYGGAFKVTGDADLDVNAMENFVIRAENLFDKVTDERRTGGERPSH